MAMRISENIKFNTMVDNLFKSQDSYNQLAEKIATLKEISRPSDDPIAMNRILNLRESKASVEQYTRNMEGCESWLTITESKLSAASDLLVKAREVAIAQSTVTASAEVRRAEAETVQQLIDEMLALANSKHEGRYLFSGTKTGEAPFSSSGRDDVVTEEPVEAGGNSFGGTVEKSGAYTGSVNKTYAVKIVEGGSLVDATYRVSEDGGKTWCDERNDLSGTITIGDGIDLDFTVVSADLADNDIFYVDAFAAGYYNGNGGEMSVNIGEGTSFAYSISGEAVFTDKGEGNFDVFGILNELKTALDANDADGIASCIDDLNAASDQISKNISMCGTRTNRLEIAKNNMEDMNMNFTELISGVEDADIIELITKLSMKEIALKASYSVAATIGNLSIINFLR